MGKYADKVLRQAQADNERGDKRFSDAVLRPERSRGLHETVSGLPPGRRPVEERGVGFLPALKGSIPSDTDTRIRVMAQERFPNEENPERRFGVVDGEIVFRDDMGRIVKATEGGMSGFGEFAANTPELARAGIGSLGGPAVAALGAPQRKSSRV